MTIHLTEPRAGAFWTPERVETARRLYIDEGMSAGEVAAILRHGATRSAVIGKAHRMGWMVNGRKPASKPSRIVSPPKIRVPRNKPALVSGNLPRPANDRDKPEPVRATLASIESPNARPWMDGRKFGECTWLIGEGISALSCCNPVLARGWCAGHHAVGTNPIQPSKLRARSASSFARHDRIEKDRPSSPQKDWTVWDDARSEAA